MPNFAYTKGKERILSASINLVTDTLHVALLREGYSVSQDTHEFLTDLGAFRISTDQVMTGKSIAGGVFDATDSVFPAVASGDTAFAIAIYKSTGVAATSPLLFYFDEIAGFPLITNGGNISPVWDDGTRRIYKL